MNTDTEALCRVTRGVGGQGALASRAGPGRALYRADEGSGWGVSRT